MFGIRNGVWFCVLLMVYGAMKMDVHNMMLGFTVFSLGLCGLMLSYLEGRFWIKNVNAYGELKKDGWED